MDLHELFCPKVAGCSANVSKNFENFAGWPTGCAGSTTSSYLTKIEMLALETVDDTLRIDNDSLESVDFGQLTNVSKINIYGTLKLKTIAPFKNLKIIDGGLVIDSNELLDNLDAFGVLEEVEDLLIRHNDALCQSDAETFASNLDVSGTTTVKDNKDCGS